MATAMEEALGEEVAAVATVDSPSTGDKVKRDPADRLITGTD